MVVTGRNMNCAGKRYGAEIKNDGGSDEGNNNYVRFPQPELSALLW